MELELSEKDYNDLMKKAEAANMSIDEYVNDTLAKSFARDKAVDDIIKTFDDIIDKNRASMTDDDIKKMTDSRDAFIVLKGYFNGTKTEEELNTAFNIADGSDE